MRKLLSLLVCCLCLISKSDAGDAKPNIIFILADDLGYGDVGCFGQKQIKTPNIDRMAAEGMKLTHFYAGSTVCAPSRCVLMTGLHTGHCYVRGNAKSNLRPEDITVAEVLKKAGYVNGLSGKWGLGHEGSSGVPTRKGFDSFFGYLDQTHAHNYYPTFLVRNETRVPLKNIVPKEGNVGQGSASKKVDYVPDLVIADALEFIDGNKDKPFFLYFATTLPHANNEAGAMEIPDLGDYTDKDWPQTQKAHAAMVTRMDSDVGKILERLKQHGIDDKTIVIFTSDNGPHKEGGNNPAFNQSSGPFRGTKRDFTDGGIRVPTVVRWPGKIKAGSSSEHLGYFGDFMATAAELAGVECPRNMDSISFLPTLLGDTEKQKQHEFLYWEFYEGGSWQAVRMGDWKLARKPMLKGKLELYNLKNDIREESNVADAHPEIVAKALKFMEQAHVPSPDWGTKAQKN